MYCLYKNVFGKHREGFHKLRIGNFALLDVVFTLIFGFLLAQFLDLNLSLTLGIIFIIAYILHKIFCII